MPGAAVRVAVFGGSAPQAGQPVYEEARQLGELLAREGYELVTGGYIGVMEAASRGASEAGGKVIGITCGEIEDWRRITANPWVAEVRREDTLVDRLEVLVRESDAWLAMPGGPGTLAEISLAWNLLVIHALPKRPLILVGAGWRRIMAVFLEEHGQYLPAGDDGLLGYADDADQAIDLLKKLLKTG